MQKRTTSEQPATQLSNVATLQRGHLVR